MREALLLKELRHPGIPIVYDVEEDSDYSYLIEEFLEGNSVYDLVMSQGYLLQEAAIGYGIQICSLVNYLHLAEKTPILHLDLQPKNLLLCHGRIKLIDFGSAEMLADANGSPKTVWNPWILCAGTKTERQCSGRTDRCVCHRGTFVVYGHRKVSGKHQPVGKFTEMGAQTTSGASL